MTRSSAGTGLAVARIAYGVVLLAAPSFAQKAFLGLNPKANETGGYLSRVLGSRELVVGVLGTGVAGPEVARAVNRLGVGIDASDVAAALIAWRQGTLGAKPATALTALGVAAISAGIWATTDAG